MYRVLLKKQNKVETFVKWNWNLSKIIMQLKTSIISKIIPELKLKFD